MMAVSIDVVEASANITDSESLSRFFESPSADYVAFAIQIDSRTMSAIERELSGANPPQLLVVCHPKDLARRSVLHKGMPALFGLLAVSPVTEPLIVMSVKAARAIITSNVELYSLDELALRVAASGVTKFVEQGVSAPVPNRQTPPLIMPPSAKRGDWVCRLIETVSLNSIQSDSRSSPAIRAGLYLFNDFFDQSHACSQSIEGDSIGDYWHAILHRREPDYGNARYWFRHVGRQPIYEELAQLVQSLIADSGSSNVESLRPWHNRLICVSGWDPFAFVDMCAAAESDECLRSWCERIQFIEMLLLLEFTYSQGSRWHA